MQTNFLKPVAHNKLRSWSFDHDLNQVVEQTETIWNELHGANLFITGGTGFIGCWLLESLRHAIMLKDLCIKATILTRDPSRFQLKAPHLANFPDFTFISGDICDFEFPTGKFTHLIHAATDASAELNEVDPKRMFDTVFMGTRRALDFALEKSLSRILFLSSGAVYGQQPWEIKNVDESWMGGPSTVDPLAAYAEGKRAAEMMCTIYKKQFGLNITIARIFALLGPYLSLDIHFAAGNFIRDAIQGKTIIVKGNGLPCRSYLYASDLTVWLWHMLVYAEPGIPYNVGSEISISIRELAEKISSVLGNVGFKVLDESVTGWNLGRYVPDTNLIRNTLGLKETISLNEAIRRTALWNGWKEN